MRTLNFVASILVACSLSIGTVWAMDESVETTAPQKKALESAKPNIISLKQSLSIFSGILKDSENKSEVGQGSLSITSIRDQLNKILTVALDYILNPAKKEILQKTHMVSGKPVPLNDSESAYSALLDMFKMIKDMQDHLLVFFPADLQQESVILRKQLEAIVKLDEISKPITPFTEEEVRALDFIRAKESTTSGRSSPAIVSSSRSSSPALSQKSSPVISRKTSLSSKEDSPVPRSRATSSAPKMASGYAYAPPSAISGSPLLLKKARANSSAPSQPK